MTSGTVWVGSMPEAYERGLAAAVFQPFAADLAERVARRSPRRVLELAAGTGVLTRTLLAAVPAAEVTATDLNQAMVDLGRERTPGATWRQADALDLSFDGGAFDAVVCQFGVMFFPDKPAAFAEARRVLAPGGVLAFNLWSTLETHAFQAALVAAVRRVFPDDPPTFMESVPHGYADVGVAIADLYAGGFDPAWGETVVLEGHAASVADVAAGYCTGTPLRAEIEARAPLAPATAAIAREMEALLGPGPVTGRMAAHVLQATPAT